MKNLVGALAVASLCMTSVATAQDCPAAGECPMGPPAAAAPADSVIEIQDKKEDDDKVFGEVEVLLNKVLLVDESGRIVMRKEFRNSLPIPAERVEGMLGQFVELGDDGKLHVKDREAIRPYLPMIRGFLGNGLNRLQELQKLPEDERRDAMRRLFGNRGGAAPEAEKPKAEAPKADKPKAREDRRMARRDDDDRSDRRRSARRDRDGDDRPRARRGRRDAPRGSVEERLTRIERSLARIERMLGQGGRDRARRGGTDRGGFLRRLFEGRDRGGRRSRGDRDRGGRNNGMRDLLDRSRTWREGLRRLFELMEPEDFSALRDGLGTLAKGGLDGESLRDPSKIMGKLQEEMSPEDTARFMEIFSEFIGTPEGRAFADDVEDTVSRLERFVNSEPGQRLGDMMRGFQGDRSELQDRLEDLIQGRDKNQDRRPAREHSKTDEKRSARRHDRQDRSPSAPPSGSKLY